MPLILVTGATGNQGGAAINALLSSGTADLQIRALTRNPSADAATALSKRGVEIVKGDLSDRQSLLAALQGVERAYLVTDFRSPRGTDGEIEQGRLFVECAKQKGVSHIVYSSAAGAGVAKDVDHFESKYIVEEALRSSGLGWTMLRPTNFMENTPPAGLPRFFFLGFMSAVFGGDKVYHIACDDIGKAAARALLSPREHDGKIVNLVGQIADVDEMQEALDRAEGYKSWRMWFPRWFALAVTPRHFKQMFYFLAKTYKNGEMPGSVAETKEWAGGALSIEEWARKQKALREANGTKKAA